MTRILAVDDDPTILLLVRSALEAPRYAVETAADGREALDRVAEGPPDLVITDVNMPRMDGWTLVRTLRTRPATVLTPVIFLTSQNAVEDRIRGFGLGADDYLPKPFHTDELEARVRSVLRRAGQAQAEAKRVVAFDGVRGTLSQISFSTLLVMLEMERATGVLLLERDDESALLVLREGRVVQAVQRGNPPLLGADCVYHLLTWDHGSFTCTPQPVDEGDQINIPTRSLLMEGARRLDEARTRSESIAPGGG